MLFFLLAIVSPPTGCQPIEHDHILGRDLALAAPALQNLASDADFGLAPVPGSVRVFEIRELKRIAAANRIEADFSRNVCFAWQTNALSRESLAEAMRKALAPRDVQIEVVDQSLWPVPNGELCFPQASLSLGGSGADLWRGYVKYGSGRRFDIWARARITVKENRLVAAEKLYSGSTVSASQLSSELYQGALDREEPYTDTKQVVGLIAKFDIPAGTILTPKILDVPHDVERGATLTVVAEIGRARVEAQCIAEESGRAGTTIAVHNARSGRRFRAMISAKGKAVVASSDALGLIAEDVHDDVEQKDVRSR